MKKLLMVSSSALAAFAFADRADSLSAAAYVQNGLVAKAAIPTQMATPSADGWYEVGITKANGGAFGTGKGYQNDGKDYEWFVGERLDFRTGSDYPVGAKLRLKGYVMLDTIPAGQFSEVDTSGLQYVIMTSDNAFEDGTKLTIPAGATAYFQAATWEEFQGTNWLVSTTGAKSVYKGDIVNRGTLTAICWRLDEGIAQA